MRFLLLLAVIAGAAVVGGFIMLSSGGPPASKVLQGVSVGNNGAVVHDLPGGKHELRLGVIVTSPRDIDQCMAFALDEPFAGRELHAVAAPGGCVRPRAGSFASSLVLPHLTDSDTMFTSHTVIWGLPGGHCGLMTIVGVCAVDSAGTFDLNLPSKVKLPTFAPFKTFGPQFSFKPIDY